MRETRAVIELLRHGEPEGGNRVRGKVDDPLSEQGWAQMQRAVEQRERWTQIVTSPLQRCARFAEHVATQQEVPLRVDAQLAEIDFGEWEGQTPEQLWSHSPDEVRRYFVDPTTRPPPGGEPYGDFETRVMQAWTDIVGEATGRWLVVAHGGTIRVILCNVLRIPPQNLFSLEVGYACLSQLAVYTDEEQTRRVVLRSHA